MMNSLKCIKKDIVFDGLKFWFRDKVVGRMPDDLVFQRQIPKSKIYQMKDMLVQRLIQGDMRGMA